MGIQGDELMTIENRRDDDSSSPAQPPIVVAIWLGQVAISQWIPTLVSIAAAVPGARIAICGDVSGSTHVLLSDCVIVAPTTVSSFVNQIFAIQ